MFKKTFKNFKEVTTFLKEERFQLYTLIVDGINGCVMTGDDSILVAEFFLTEDDLIFKIEMNEGDWHESLHLALYYFEEVEEYEKCIEIRELIKELYG